MDCNNILLYLAKHSNVDDLPMIDDGNELNFECDVQINQSTNWSVMLIINLNLLGGLWFSVIMIY